ncbi:MAG: GNAT family N-acetyltransferase [Daejeonella sp.]
MLTIIRTDSANPDFIELVKELDADLAFRDGDDHAYYAQFNKIQNINYCLVAYQDEKPISCGAIKEFDAESMEVKRMFSRPEWRGQGMASKILQELQTWTAELGYKKCVLETGKNQPEAIALYLKSGFEIIPNYGQYAGVENSVCFEKRVV